MKTEAEREIDHERHDEDVAARKEERRHRDAGEDQCPVCNDWVDPTEIERCICCERRGCSSCVTLLSDESGPLCNDACRERYYWDREYDEIRALFIALGLNLPGGYWASENPHEVVTHDDFRAFQVDFISGDGPILRVQMLERKAG